MRRLVTGMAAWVMLQSAAYAFTPDEAAKLQADLQGYFGTREGVVKVEAMNDAYKATFDFTPFYDDFKKAGTIISISPLALQLKPAANNKWQVSFDGPFKLSTEKAPELKLDETFESLKFTGEFDTSLGTFSSLDAAAKNIAIAEDIIDPTQGPLSVKGTMAELSLKQTAVANPAGGTDIKLSEVIGAFNGDLKFKASGDAQDTALNFKSEGGDMSLQMNGAKTLELWSLVKFLNAHPDKEMLKKNEAEFKAALKAFLPVWNNLTADGAMKNLEATTPVGLVKVSKVTFGANVNGVVKDGKFEEKFGVENVVLPPGIVPPWAEGLVPKNSSFDFMSSGFDALAPALEFLEKLDVQKNEEISQELSKRLQALFLPKGVVEIGLGKSFVSNDTYNVSFEGSMSAGPEAKPTGKALITAKGLDTVMKLLAAAPSDADLQQAAAFVLAAKGMGKSGTDGEVTWDIVATPDDKITINGVDVTKLAQ